MVDTPPIPTARIGQLFASPSDDSRMFPVAYSEAKEANTLGLKFAGNNSAPPASIRHYNPGAVGERSDGGHKLLGATSMADLPGNDGNALSTPAFDSPADGVAYYGYFIQARVGDQPTIDKIMKAYATGHPDAYKQYIKSQTGLDTTEVLDDDQLASVARAMFEWESGGTQPYSTNAQALTQMLNNVDIKAQIQRGRTAHKTQAGPNGNTSANDSIGASLTKEALNRRAFSEGLGLNIDTSAATMARRVAQEKRRLLAQPTPQFKIRY
ncbi:MAG: hypothetical protein L7S63_08315 [Flavobacteriales bacterium]|nr:hypothetical protein [Flavobacteriales bacterium]